MKIRIFEVNIKPLADEIKKVNSQMEKFENDFQPMKPYLVMNSKTACVFDSKSDVVVIDNDLPDGVIDVR